MHFCNDPAYLEREMPGWSSLGSAWGSTRAEDGICSLHALYLSATQSCERFEARTERPRLAGYQDDGSSR
jgi:hypothetical protein